MADGSITFSTELDNSEFDKQLSELGDKTVKKVESRIKTLKRTLEYSTGVKDRVSSALAEADAKVDDLRNRIERYSGRDSGYDREALRNAQAALPSAESRADKLAELLERSSETVRSVEAELKSAESELARYKGQTDGIQSAVEQTETAVESAADATKSISPQIEEIAGKAGEVPPQIKESVGIMYELRQNTIDAGAAMDAFRAHVDKFTVRVKKLAKRVFVFTVITGALRSVKNWMWQVIQTSDEAKSAMGQLKGALLTMAQPLAELVIPLFTAFVRILTAIISTLAQIIALITGKSISAMKSNAKSLNAQAEAIDGVGESAKDASKYLAGFDELNVMDSSDSGGGGGGSSSGGISPDFDFDANKSEGQLRNLLALIEAGAAALLGWKFGNGFKDGLTKAIGYFLIMDGAVRTITSIFDAWNNGVSFENLNGMITGITEIVVGLYVALGPTAAAIGAVVGGIAMLITGIKDAMDVGFNAQNLMMTIMGMLVAGIGIGVLTGSWIPLLIAGIAGLLLVITNFFGDSEKLLSGFRDILDGFKLFFTGLFTGDIEKSIEGIQKIFGGLKTVVFSIFDAIQNMIFRFLDWLDEKTGGKLHGIIEFAKSMIGLAFDDIRFRAEHLITAVELIFGGLIKFVSGVFTGDWETAWEGIKDIFRGVWNGIVGVLGSGINIIIRALNWLISKMNTISFTVPDWVPGIGGKYMGISIKSIPEYQIPYLARGAVIPPNREFMAVLGDQKRGNNIEAPEDLIRKIVREESGNNGGTHVTIVLDSVDGKKLFDAIVRQNNAVVRATGASPLKV